jgi:chemotaxis family two-component system sensor kinase Cph1
VGLGAHGAREIPVPIPNTEVKPSCGDYTATSGKLARCRIIRITLRTGGFSSFYEIFIIIDIDGYVLPKEDGLKRVNSGVADQKIANSEQLATILESMDDGFFILDKDFKFVFVNKKYEELSDVKREDSLGKILWEVFPAYSHKDTPYWRTYHQVAKTKKPAVFNAFHERKDLWIEVNAYPTHEGGVAVFIHDITDKVQAERLLQESESRFRALTSASSDVVYRMNPDWSEMLQLDGRNFLADTGEPDKNWLKKYIHPNDQKRVIAAIRNAIDSKSVFELEHQVRQADGTLGWTFSRAIPIGDSEGNIIEWFGAASDVTARKRAEEDRQQQIATEQRMEILTEQRNALLKVNRVKDEFIALASHQLRTPATIVKQYAELLLNDFAGELTDQQREFLEVAHESNERELRIINDLLKTAQIDASNYGLEIESYDIADLVRQIIDELSPTLQQRHQKVTLQGGDKNLNVDIDVKEIMLAVSNLIENASKYSHQGANITVSLKSKGKYTEIAVQDKGVGISEDDQQKVFDKFIRVDNELSDTVSGTGLGLYWVKQIALMHKGSVGLVSEPGKGSVFTMRLPQ